MKKWSKKEIEKLRKLYSEEALNIHEIAKILGRSVTSVKSKAVRMGFKRPKDFPHRTRKWTKDMDEILIRDYPTIPASEIAKKLGVTIQAVYARAQLLGIKKQVVRKSFIGEWFTPKVEKVKSDKVAYIAGIIDGEGTLSIHKTPTGYSPVIQIVNTNKELIEFIRKYLGGASFCEIKHKHRKREKNCYYLKIRKTKKVLELCKLFLPYLIVKREQAKILIEFCRAKLRGDLNKQKELYYRIKKLNAKGVENGNNGNTRMAT